MLIQPDLAAFALVAAAGCFAGVALSMIVRRVAPRNFGGRGSDELASREDPAFLINGGRIVAISPAATRLYGTLKRDAAAAKALSEVFRAEEGDFASDLESLVRHGARFETSLRDADARIYDAFGEPRGAAAVVVLREARASATAISRAETALSDLRERERIWRALLDAAPASMWRTDREGGVVWSNVRLADGGLAPLPGALAGAPPAPGLRRADAADPEAHADEKIVPAPDGGAFVYSMDVSGRLDAERGLRSFVQTMTEVFAHLNAGLAIFDREGKLALFNPAFAEMFDADPTWLVTRPHLGDILDRTRENRLVPETTDYRAWKSELLDLFNDEQETAYDGVWALHDGRTFRVLGRPHPNGGLAFVFEDVTEWIHLRRGRTEALETQQAILNGLDLGIAIFDPNGVARAANPAFARLLDAPLEGARISALAAACGARWGAEAVWTRLSDTVFAAEARTAWSERIESPDGTAMLVLVKPLPDGGTLVAVDGSAGAFAAARLRSVFHDAASMVAARAAVDGVALTIEVAPDIDAVVEKASALRRGLTTLFADLVWGGVEPNVVAIEVMREEDGAIFACIAIRDADGAAHGVGAVSRGAMALLDTVGVELDQTAAAEGEIMLRRLDAASVGDASALAGGALSA